MKIFKSRLCLLLSFILASQTILYANPVGNKHEYTIEECKNIIRIKMLEPRIEAIDTALKSGLLTEQEINDFTAQKYHLQSETTKSLPIGVTPEEYIEKIYDSKQSVVQNKSSGGGGSSSSTPQIADTFSKKLILNGLDVINEELSMATTSDSILKLNNMKNIFNELFDDCKNDNITFPREYTKEEIIEIVNRLNEETRKATNSSLKTTDIYSYNAQPLAKKGYGRRPIFGGYLTDICVEKSPLDGKEYPYIYTLISFSNFDDIGFYGGKIDLEIWVDGVKVAQKTPQHYGWDGDKSVNFGFNLVAKPISLYEQFGDFDVNETHRVDLKTTVLGDYSFDVCGVKNPAIKYFTNNGKDMIDYVKDTRYLVFDEDMVFPKTTDSIIDIPSTTESIYTLR